MSKYKAPNPGKGWRLLKVGEAIPDGVELYGDHDGCRKWEESFLWVGRIHTQDERYRGWFYRTRTPKPKPEVTVYTHKANSTIEVPNQLLENQRLHRLLTRIYKAKSIREARGMIDRARGKK